MDNKPNAPTTLEKFIVRQAELLKDIVNDVVDKAVKGAISDDEGPDEFGFAYSGTPPIRGYEHYEKSGSEYPPR